MESAWKANTVNLTRAEYGPWAAARACLERIKMALQAANQSAETIVANVMQQLRSLPAVPAPPTAASEAQNENGPPAQANRPPAEGSPSTRPESTTGAKQQPQAQPAETSASPINGKPNPPESKEPSGPLTLKEMAVLVSRARGPLGASEVWEKGLEMGLAESVSAKGSDRGSLRSILNRAAMNPASVIERRDGKFQLKKNAPPAQDSSTDGKRPMAVKFERKDPIPPAPRKPDGRIDWKKVPTELLQMLADKGPIAQIAEAWEVSTSVVYKHCYKRGLHGRHDWKRVLSGRISGRPRPRRNAVRGGLRPRRRKRRASQIERSRSGPNGGSCWNPSRRPADAAASSASRCPLGGRSVLNAERQSDLPGQSRRNQRQRRGPLLYPRTRLAGQRRPPRKTYSRRWQALVAAPRSWPLSSNDFRLKPAFDGNTGLENACHNGPARRGITFPGRQRQRSAARIVAKHIRMPENTAVEGGATPPSQRAHDRQLDAAWYSGWAVFQPRNG